MNTKVRFLDLSVDGQEQERLLSSIRKVLIHGRIILGPEVEAFEKEIADYCGRKYCVAVGSGTTSLFVGCKAIGLGEGDEVITTPLSWIASVNSFYLLGAKPVFADIGDDLNISPESVERLITDKSKAILAVDYSGRPCKWDKLKDIADRHDLLLIEDGSQAMGASFNGEKVGSFGDISCISMNSMKLLASLGEAGVVLTDDEAVYDELLNQRYCGMIDKTVCYNPSLNGRMDTIQAAMLLERLETFEDKIEKRRENADYYNKRFTEYLKLPDESAGEYSVYYTYLIAVNDRPEFVEYMKESGIEVSLRDTLLISEQPVYRNCRTDELVNSEKWVDQLIAIPSSERLTEGQREYVADRVLSYFRGEK